MRKHATVSSRLLLLAVATAAVTGIAYGDSAALMTAAAANDIELSANARGNFIEHRAKLDLEFVFRAQTEDPRRVRGELTVDWGDGKDPESFDFDRKVETKNRWREPGTYRIRYTLVTRSGERVRGNLRFEVQPILRAFLSVLGEQSPRIEEEQRYRFLAIERDTREQARKVPGLLTIDWGDGSEITTVAKFDGDVVRKHAYAEAGEYQIIAELFIDDRRFRKVITVEATDSAVPDLSQVVSLHARDIATWRVTSTISNVTISTSQICIFHSKQGKWPQITESDGDRLEGNPWVVAKVGNRWYAATYEWLKPGQACKGITKGNIGAHTSRAPLTGSWRPSKGEILGFFVSTVGRLNERTSNERSGVWVREFPY